MPELPEVENLRRGLESNIISQKIKSVEVRNSKIIFSKGGRREHSKAKQKEFISGLTGEKFLHVGRRAKNLIFKLSHGKIILAHLKMTGQFVYQPKSYKLKPIIGGHPIEISETELPNKHTHVIFKLEKGMLYYNDTRMFGYVLYYPSEDKFNQGNHFEKYGHEPLSKEFTLEYFTQALKKKNSKIKTLLMNQEIVTGAGNIYSDESLFASRIDPRRLGSSLSASEIKLLYKNLISILERATKVGGSSVATYRLLDDSRGNYAREHKVYGKDGKNCLRCGKPLKKIIVAGRTTIFCPNFQK